VANQGRAGDGSPGLLMGRPFGIPVYVSSSWFIVAALITLVFAPTVEQQVPDIGAARYVVSFGFALLLYLSVLIHELSHSVVALRLGLPVRRITLHLLGGVSEIEREPETPGREFLVAFAGPLLSAVLGALGFLLVHILQPGTVAYVLAAQVTIANIIVAVFNLLPGLPLDGGRVLQAGVWKLSGRRLTGIVAAGWAGRVVAVAVILIPLLAAVATGTSPNLVWVIWSALIASFVWLGASQAITQAHMRARLPNVAVHRLLRPSVSVASDLPLSEAVRRADEAGAGAVVVVDGAGRPLALVNEAAVTATPEQRRPWVPVSSVARSIDPGLVLPMSLAGEALLEAIQGRPSSEYLVTGPDGEVVGVLALTDVERAVTGA
jgi:Zn-dependent protease/CBS domain-containing protein